MSKETRWLPLFLKFIKQLRIQSKEVPSEDNRGAPLVLWDSQKLFLEQLAEGLEDGVRTFYVLKSRQIGISTITMCIDIFWLAMHPNILGALVVEKESNRSKFRALIKSIVASFPPGFVGTKFKIVKDNRDFMLFSNGSRLDFLVAGARKDNWGEGQGYAFAHCTEVAAYGNPKGLTSFQESWAEAHPDRLFILESTAKGFNHWRALWIDAGQDTITIRRIFLGWWSKPSLNSISRKDNRWPIYGAAPPSGEELELINVVKEKYNYDISMEQLAWYRWRSNKESSTAQDLDQNQPWDDTQAFVQSGYSFFQTRVLQEDLVRIGGSDDHEPVKYKGYRYEIGNDFWAIKLVQIVDAAQKNLVELRVWEEPVPNAQYVIGCDPAYGRTDWGNNHGISVWRCYADRLIQVAEYANNDVETKQATWILAHLAGAYRNCVINMDLQGGPGRVMMLELDQLRVQLRAEVYNEHIANSTWEDALDNARWYLYHRPDSMGAGYAYNFVTGGNNKWEIMNQLRDSYSTRVLLINSMPLVEELLEVVQEGYYIGAAGMEGKVGAPGRGKDDRVFAAALANRAWLNWFRVPMTNEGMTYARITAAEQGQPESITPVLDRIVGNFFKRQEELAGMAAEPPQWLRDRGLA